MPSSEIILNIPRPLNASGLVCLLILRTSRGSKTTSPRPIKLCARHLSHHRTQSRRYRDALSPASKRIHHRLPRPLPERLVELIAMVLGQVIPHKRLTAVLVHPLKNLETSIASTSREPSLQPPSEAVSRPRHTLYAAAYPNPGNSDSILVDSGAPAFSLKITPLSTAAEFT